MTICVGTSRICSSGSAIMQCLLQDRSLKTLPANITHVGGTYVPRPAQGPPSLRAVCQCERLHSRWRAQRPAALRHLRQMWWAGQSLASSKTCRAPSPTSNVVGRSVVGELKDLTRSVTYVDVAGLSVGGELKDLPPSVAHVDVLHTSVVGEFEELPASVICAVVASGASRCRCVERC